MHELARHGGSADVDLADRPIGRHVQPCSDPSCGTVSRAVRFCSLRPSAVALKPAPFGYCRASSVDEAVHALALRGDEAKVIAGGQSLVPMMNLRLVRPSFLVDVNRISELGHVSVVDDSVRVGAMVRHAQLETDSLVLRDAPLLAVAARHIGHGAIRNRGTVGGSLAHADPAAELPACMVALDATFEISGTDRSRTVPAAEFFDGLFSTVLAYDELLVAVHVPRHGSAGVAYEEVSIRAGDFAVVGVAAVVTLDDAGVVEQARIAISGAAWLPVRASAAEQALVGRELTPASLGDAGALAAAATSPSTDVHGSADYRRHLADVLTRRAVAVAAGLNGALSGQPDTGARDG